MYQTILSRPWQAPNDVTHILSTGSSHLILLFLIWLNYFVFNHLLISHYFIPSLCLFSVMSPFIYSPLILNPHQLIQSPLPTSHIVTWLFPILFRCSRYYNIIWGKWSWAAETFPRLILVRIQKWNLKKLHICLHEKGISTFSWWGFFPLITRDGARRRVPLVTALISRADDMTVLIRQRRAIWTINNGATDRGTNESHTSVTHLSHTPQSHTGPKRETPAVPAAQERTCPGQTKPNSHLTTPNKITRANQTLQGPKRPDPTRSHATQIRSCLTRPHRNPQYQTWRRLTRADRTKITPNGTSVHTRPDQSPSRPWPQNWPHAVRSLHS